MKKIIIALFAVLGVATSVSAQKFGHVDTQSIMQSLPEITKANGELQAKAQEYENELKTMQEELQRQADDFDKKKATMSATEQQTTQTKLEEMYTKIQQAYQQNQQNIQKMQEEIMAPIYKRVKTAIENVGKAGNYTYIFEASSPLYVGPGSTDVTSAVKAEINKLK